MKSIVATSLALSLLGAGLAAAQGSAGAGLIEGVAGRPELTAGPRRDITPSPPPVADDAADEDASPRGNPLWAIPLDSLRATRERPVFSESRRPPIVAAVEPPRPVVAPPEPEPVEPEPPALTLVGTVIGTDETIAVFLDPAAREVVRLRIGEEGSGWTLRSIDPRSTVFEKDSREVTLSLPAPDTRRDADGPNDVGTFVPTPFPPHQAKFPPPRARPPGPPPGRLPGLGARARSPSGREF